MMDPVNKILKKNLRVGDVVRFTNPIIDDGEMKVSRVSGCRIFIEDFGYDVELDDSPIKLIRRDV